MFNLMYDYQILLMQHYGGISRYFNEVITRLPEEEVKLYFPVINNMNYYFEDYFGKPVKKIEDKRKYRRVVSRNQKYTEWMLRRKGKNIVFHPTYYNPYFLDAFKGKLVVTVHDMIHENYPEYFAGNLTIEHKKILMERADSIIAVSNATKDDILSIYPHIDDNKIKVVYHGSDQVKADVHNAAYEEKYLRKGEFILYVGNRDRYKNFENFAKAAARIMRDMGNLQLVCVGGGELLAQEQAVFEKEKCLDRVIQRAASEDELTWLYQHAKCFVFPSKAEGFGIPILEAWKNECPVIVADTKCFREVGGDAVIYFDPDHIEEIAQSIYDTAVAGQNTEKLIQNGKKRLKEFSWDACAAKHFQTYRELGEQ